MHFLNKRASTFPLTTISSEPNPHHHPPAHQHQRQQVHPLTTTITTTSSAPAPRASSEHGIYYSSVATTTACTPRTSCSDEAQACFNLLLILRADTQHLISLRNDNLDMLERTGPARPLLHSINDALAAAARSIAELGPFLERHRWAGYDPAAVGTKTERAYGGGDGASSHQRRSLASYSLIRPVFLRRSKGPSTATTTPMTTTPTTTKRRRRCKSLSNSPSTTAAGATPSAPGWEEEAGWLSPETLFSWTLELTAQHTAALVALDRLERFLAYGVAALREEEEEGAREASAKATEEDAARRRASWWEQQRGEFENVGLIQSLMTGPRRRRLSGGGKGAISSINTADEMVAMAATAATEADKEGKQRIVGDDSATSDLPPISEQQDDARSMTIVSEPPSELSMPATPHWGLTARPRVPPKAVRLANDEEPIRTRRVMTEPVSCPPPPSTPPQQPVFDNPQLSSRSETFGQSDEMNNSSTSTTLPLSRFNSLRQRPRIATQALPSLVGLPALVLPERQATTRTEESSDSNIHNTTNYNNTYLSLPQHQQAGGGGSTSPSSALSATTPLLSPLLFTPSGDGQQASSSSPSPSPAVETPYTPYTPLDQQLANLFAPKVFPYKSKTIQPMIRELEDMVVSPVESHMVTMSFLEHGVSPITTTTSTTGGHHQLPSPRKGSLVSLSSSSAAAALQQQQHRAPASPHAMKAAGEHEEDDDKHWPYLAYMARKQAVATSRWSLRRSRTTASDSG